MPTNTPTFDSENQLRSLGFERVAGIDEVGRGALAGPVVAAAVLFPCDCPIEGLRDSKLLPERRREELYDEILTHAISWGVGIVGNEQIDRINILQATFVAMRIAFDQLTVAPDYVLIDGRDAVALGKPCRPIIGGDGICCSIAAASIVAKVTRDRIMRQYHELLPQYGLDRNKGYGTDEHRRAILEHGVTPIHRWSFLSKLLETG
jgi:ribonuclease HII